MCFLIFEIKFFFPRIWKSTQIEGYNQGKKKLFSSSSLYTKRALQDYCLEVCCMFETITKKNNP